MYLRRSFVLVADEGRITAVTLTLKGSVPGLSAVEFTKLAEDAKANCPVSKVLNATITLDATLE